MLKNHIYEDAELFLKESFNILKKVLNNRELIKMYTDFCSYFIKLNNPFVVKQIAIEGLASCEGIVPPNDFNFL